MKKQIVKLKEITGESILYNYESHEFENTYDSLSMKDVLEFIVERNKDTFFLDYEEFEKALEDFYFSKKN